MTTIRTSARVGPDGRITIPVGTDEVGREVIVTVTPVPEPTSQAEWEAFVDRTAGSIPDPAFVRPDQGSFEKREELE
jgi:hypothetical protein